MKFIKILLASALVSLPSICQPAEFWSGETTVTHLYPTSNMYVFNVTYANSLSTCDNGRRFRIDMANPNYNALVSSLLAAFMAGKKINFNVDDAQGSSCEPSINRFFIYQ